MGEFGESIHRPGNLLVWLCLGHLVKSLFQDRGLAQTSTYSQPEAHLCTLEKQWGESQDRAFGMARSPVLREALSAPQLPSPHS